MAVVRAGQDRADLYRPVRAVSMTGLFPGFARPHFTPENLQSSEASANTVYVQHIQDEQIIAFEPLEEGSTEGGVAVAEAPAVRIGDPAVYAYAFGPSDAVVGDRGVVAQAIEDRFDEIAAKEFAACTAAQFARLVQRLPDVNRRAFRLLAELDTVSSRQWRDSIVFLITLRDELRSMHIRPGSVQVRSQDKDNRLEVTLSVTFDRPHELPRKQTEDACRKLLIGTGLFRQNDVFTLQLESTAGDLAVGQLRMVEAGELDAVMKEAKFFLEEKVFLPAMRGSSRRIVNLVRDTRQWISKFQKIGDLIRYIDRFQPDTDQPPLPFAEIKQIRFEDVHAEFVTRFGRYRGFQTTIADFTEGATYSPFTLSIYTRTYNNRGGGIRPVGKIGAHQAVVVNITLSGSKYANEWLSEGVRLKCYLKAPRKTSESQFEESHEANRSIMEYPRVPILVFTRMSGQSDFVYRGIFRYIRVTADDGGKWFELVKTGETIA